MSLLDFHTYRYTLQNNNQIVYWMTEAISCYACKRAGFMKKSYKRLVHYSPHNFKHNPIFKKSFSDQNDNCFTFIYDISGRWHCLLL